MTGSTGADAPQALVGGQRAEGEGEEERFAGRLTCSVLLIDNLHCRSRQLALSLSTTNTPTAAVGQPCGSCSAATRRWRQCTLGHTRRRPAPQPGCTSTISERREASGRGSPSRWTSLNLHVAPEAPSRHRATVSSTVPRGAPASAHRWPRHQEAAVRSGRSRRWRWHATHATDPESPIASTRRWPSLARD